MRTIPFTFGSVARTSSSSVLSYSSIRTWISVCRGLSNWRHTSLVPIITETQSGLRSSTSVCHRALRSRTVLPLIPWLTTRIH